MPGKASRKASVAGGELLELRGLHARELVEALDMIALSKGRSRTALVDHVLTVYVASKQHEASLISRTTRVNPPPPDSDWSPLG